MLKKLFRSPLCALSQHVAATENPCCQCYNQAWYGGYSSVAERLTVAQDVVGSIPTSRPKYLPFLFKLP